MKNKLLRILDYTKHIFLMLLLTPLGAVIKLFSPSYRRLWLVGERGNDARDNGYWFYKFLKTYHPEINARYVITSDSEDFAKIAVLGGAVKFRSFRHYLSYYSADYLISTHVQPCSPDMILHYHLAAKGISARGKQVFLQHGITKDEMEWLHYPNLRVDLFVCGAKTEYEYIRDTFNHPEGVARYLGFCRFDNLIKAAKPKREILVMPTWRGSKYPGGDSFNDTAFYKYFMSLLNSQKLISMLEENDYTLVFYPHIEMQKYIDRFTSTSDRVIIASKKTHDVQQLLMDCALLVTDYSSVFFDVAYIGKPVLYYQFDEEEFFKYHYSKGYFDYRKIGFGPVCVDETELIHNIAESFENGFALSPMQAERVAQFFPIRDDNNCQRTFDAISSLKDRKKKERPVKK